MNALQEENRLWLLLARKQNKLKKAAINVSVRGAFRPYLFLFVFYHFPSEAQDFLVSVLIIFIFTLDPYHINTPR